MNIKSIIASSAMILTFASLATADPFTDVPASHWAYDAVKSMADKGVIQGFPDNSFKGESKVTRYQMAMMISQALVNISEKRGNVSNGDLMNVERLTVEFADELALLGIKVSSLEDNMQVLKDDVSSIKQDVDKIKSNFKNGGIEKIKLSGDLFVHNYGTEIKNGAHLHRTGTKLRLKLDAQVDENVKAVARWRIVDNNNTDFGPVGVRGAAWNGTNHASGEVDNAYLQINDMFRFHGDFIFGRRFMTHGHCLVMNDTADVISYIKRCGDVDLAANVFFKRQNNDDTHNIWNINADTKFRGHDMYLGLYYLTYDATEAKNILGQPADPDFAGNPKEYDLEYGSKGDLGNNGYWSYDFSTVYQHVDDAKIKTNNERTDRDGFILHGGINWDSKEEWAAKFAYTMVDDEANMGTIVSYDERFMDSTENPLEDIMRDARYTNNIRAIRQYVNNLQDIKVQVEYIPRNNNKHYLRLAYDLVEPKSSSKDSTLFTAGNGNSDKADVFSAEYRYRLAENTRFRAGYTDFKYGSGNSDRDYKVYWTELYSQF